MPMPMPMILALALPLGVRAPAVLFDITIMLRFRLLARRWLTGASEAYELANRGRECEDVDLVGPSRPFDLFGALVRNVARGDRTSMLVFSTGVAAILSAGEEPNVGRELSPVDTSSEVDEG